MDHQSRFVIEASEVESIVESSGLSLTHLLQSLVKSAQSLARPSISNFPVAAVAVGPSGRIFVGVNLEFPGLPLHHTLHAEQFLLTNLFLHSESTLHYVVVSAPPCGHCRQIFQEIREAPNIKILITSLETLEFSPLSQFLPHRFGPHDLLPHHAPLLLESHHNGLEIKTENHDSCNGGHVNQIRKLKVAALEAANKSYAPYSESPSGVSLVDSDGSIYKGSYIESAAHNPSIGPVQAALVAFVAGDGGDYDTIVAAALVEKDGATVKQEATARLLLHSISPNCHFNVFLCQNIVQT